MKFSEIPHFIINKFIERSHALQNEAITDQQINVEDSYLYGPRKRIVTFEEGRYLELYVKYEDGFSPVSLRTEPGGYDDNKFYMTPVHNLNFPSDLYDTIQEEHYDEDGDPYYSYVFEVYNLWENKKPLEIENGLPLYMRKDSIFHDWIRNYAAEIFKDTYNIDFVMRQYVNTDKSFIYLGVIYEKKS